MIPTTRVNGGPLWGDCLIVSMSVNTYVKKIIITKISEAWNEGSAAISFCPYGGSSDFGLSGLKSVPVMVPKLN